ncbi:MAG: RsmB/NOP family class I SAM-dependent RNA methyltransferase [Candidatus Heimdallarchaeota archaeon]
MPKSSNKTSAFGQHRDAQKTVAREFIKRWEFFYGKERAQELFHQLRLEDPRIIAPNTLLINLHDLQRRLERQGFKFSTLPEYTALGVQYEPFNLVATPEYLGGWFSIQALSSLIPPRVLPLDNTATIADLAAAPGIKTSLLAMEMKNHGTILALEKSKKRLSALKATLARMGVHNTFVINLDSTKFAQLHISVSGVLLDAPCSGTGLKLTKDKRLAPRILSDISRLASIQSQLLENAWQQLQKGGTLVYSTCSLEPEEGEVLIDTFVSQRKPEEVELLPIPIQVGWPGNETHWYEPFSSPSLEHTRRIFPDIGIDGFFIAMMRKLVR